MPKGPSRSHPCCHGPLDIRKSRHHICRVITKPLIQVLDLGHIRKCLPPLGFLRFVQFPQFGARQDEPRRGNGNIDVRSRGPALCGPVEGLATPIAQRLHAPEGSIIDQSKRGERIGTSPLVVSWCAFAFWSFDSLIPPCDICCRV